MQRLDGDGVRGGLLATIYMAIAQKTEELGWAKVSGGGGGGRSGLLGLVPQG